MVADRSVNISDLPEGTYQVIGFGHFQQDVTITLRHPKQGYFLFIGDGQKIRLDAQWLQTALHFHLARGKNRTYLAITTADFNDGGLVYEGLVNERAEIAA